MKPNRNAISYVIYSDDRSMFLIVQRSEDDPDLPSVWGLPAGLVEEGETPEDAVCRSMKEKLGVEGKAIKFLKDGSTERETYNLYMRLYEAKIVNGTPNVPQNVQGVTQYVDMMWGSSDNLNRAASMGSLCCNLYLEYTDQS